MHNNLVILGTGTEVGKTYATCQLAAIVAGRRADSRVLAVKPIETGVTCLEVTDAARLGNISVPTSRPAHAYAFEPAVSPHLASRMSSARIDLRKILRWIDERRRSIDSGDAFNAYEPSWVLIETAGGVFSPISEECTNLDLAVALEPSLWVLVAPDRLGVLHDIRATLIAMATLARIPDIILLNATRSQDASAGTNRRELELLGWASVTAQIAWNGGIEETDRAALLEQLGRTSQHTNEE